MKAVCGLDVHKDSIYLCILHPDGELFEQVFGVLTFMTVESLTSMRKLCVRNPKWMLYSNGATSA